MMRIKKKVYLVGDEIEFDESLKIIEKAVLVSGFIALVLSITFVAIIL